MPSKEAHKLTAERNAEFAGSIPELSETHCLWAVTIYFYSAVHYIEAFFAVKGLHSPDHSTRRREIKADPILRAIWTQYSFLEDASRLARYECKTPPLALTRDVKSRLDYIRAFSDLNLKSQP